MLAKWPWLSFWQAVAAIGTLAAAFAAWFSAAASRDAVRANLKWQRLGMLQKIHEDLKQLAAIPMWPQEQDTPKFRMAQSGLRADLGALPGNAQLLRAWDVANWDYPQSEDSAVRWPSSFIEAALKEIEGAIASESVPNRRD
jgi:hypothetical protein